MNRSIVKFNIKMLFKTLMSKALEFVPSKSLRSFSEVTIFISSFGTRYPLQLTIESLIRNTKYPNFRILVAENGSIDGSKEYLESVRQKYPLDVIYSPEPKQHKDWLNEMYQIMQTPFWLAVDSDMLFLGTDWLTDMMRVMENNTDLFLLAAEKCEASYGVVEPVGLETIDAGERFSTWLFCIRTSLRDHVTSDFSFYDDHIDPKNGRRFCYDVGGKLLADVQKKGLKTAYMPKWFRNKFYHFSNLSWSDEGEAVSNYQKLKQYQKEYIKQRVSSVSEKTENCLTGHNHPKTG